LKIDEEYFVDENFSGKEKYIIHQGILYIKASAITLQLKDPDGADIATDEKYHAPLGMDEDTIDYEFPLVSQDVLLFSGKALVKSNVFKPAKALIMPSYKSPLFRLLPLGQVRFLRNEFYYYPKSLDEEYIVYRLNRNDIGCVEF
jgi:hypothetical protein